MSKRPTRTKPNLPRGMRWKTENSIEYRFTIESHEGTLRESVSGGTVQQCHDLAAIRRSEGQRIQWERNTIGGFLSEWLTRIKPIPGDEDPEPPKVRWNTYTTRESSIRVHVLANTKAARFRDLQLAKLQASHIDELLTGLTEQAVGSRARQLLFETLRAAFRYAYKTRRIRENVIDFVLSRPRHRTPSSPDLTDVQIVALLEEIEKRPRWTALYYIAIMGGLRQGEIFALSWNDVDLTTGALSVQGNLTATEVGKKITRPKTESAIRRMLLPTDCMEVLRSHRKRQLANGAANSLVFPSLTGAPLDRSTFRKKVHLPIVRAAMCPNVTFHDLRHLAATLYVASDTNPKALGDVMGHSDFRTTMKLYAKVTDGLRAETAAKIGSLVRKMRAAS